MQITISAPFLSPVESSNNGVAEPSKHSLGLRININNQTQRGHKVQKEHAFIIVIAGMLLTSRQGVLCCRNGTKKICRTENMVVNVSACIRKYVTLVYEEVDRLQCTKVRMTLKVPIFSSPQY